MKKTAMDRLGDFITGKGFYIVLLLCVAAIGVSGYYLFSSLRSDLEPDAPVAGQIQVTVTPLPSRRPAASPVPPVQRTPLPTPARSSPPAPAATTAPTPAPAAPLVFTWPVKGEILSPFTVDALAYDATMGDWRVHSGIDIAADQGIQVLAAAQGTVVAVETDGLMGTCITIDHGDGLRSVYANLDPQVQVLEGDAVFTGDIIGQVGDTAIAESALAPHLHFSLLRGEQPADPLDYLPGRT